MLMIPLFDDEDCHKELLKTAQRWIAHRTGCGFSVCTAQSASTVYTRELLCTSHPAFFSTYCKSARKWPCNTCTCRAICRDWQGCCSRNPRSEVAALSISLLSSRQQSVNGANHAFHTQPRAQATRAHSARGPRAVSSACDRINTISL